MFFYSFVRGLLKRWWVERAQPEPRRPRSLRRARKSLPRRPGLEALEDRTLMAVLPAPVVSDPRALTDNDLSTSFPPTLPPLPAASQGHTPSLAIDPLDPRKMVVAYTNQVTNLRGDGGPVGILKVAFTTNGGETWTFINNALIGEPPFTLINRPDPALVQTNFYDFAHSPSIAYDRQGNFYIVYAQSDNNNTAGSGAIVLQRYNFSGASPVQTITNNILYQWFGADPAFNPVVAVDNNVPSFTDPTTGVTQVDTLVGKAVYVAWNTENTAPSAVVFSLATPHNPNTIQIMASADGGTTFTGRQHVLNSGNLDAANQSLRAAAPQVIFTQGTAGTPGGNMVILWNGAGAGAPGENIRVDVTRPDGGILNQPAAAALLFTGTGGNLADAIVPAMGPHTPGVSTFQLTLTAAQIAALDPNSFFDLLRDLDVTVNMRHLHLNQVSLVLTAQDRNGAPLGPAGGVTLLINRTLNDGTQRAGTPTPGVVDAAHLGLVGPNDNQLTPVGTVFNDQAPRIIRDPGATAPYAFHIRPEIGQLSQFNNLTRDQLTDSVWTLTITDNRSDGTMPPPIQFLVNWSLRFSARISTTGFGTDRTVTAPFRLNGVATNANFQNANPVSARGLGSTPSIAADRTLGSFSPFQGRVYIAYTGRGSGPTTSGNAANDTDVYVIYSNNITDPLGPTWSSPVRVNNDLPQDGFTVGNRPQFLPVLTVDPVTGTVVITYSDARWDAAQQRAARFLGASIDGGDTWGPVHSFLNPAKTATDAVDGETVVLEPIPDNQSSTGNAGVLGFGNRAGVVAYGGRVTPVWAGNFNRGGTFVLTATASVAGGPRLINGDMGPVVVDGSTGTYNTSFAADGTRRLDGFVVEFDRRIDPATFGADDIRLIYRDTSTAASGPGEDISSAVSAIEPLDLNAIGASRFLVRLVPQVRVGTYSYSVGPLVRDRIRTEPLGAGAIVPLGEFRFASANPLNLPIGGTPAGGSGVTTSTLAVNVPPLPSGPAQVVRDLTVNLTINHPNPENLRIELVAPNGASVFLVNFPAFGVFGSDFINTTFDDQSVNLVPQPSPGPGVPGEARGAGAPPFIGVFRPLTPLGQLVGIDPNGDWTLRITNVVDPPNTGRLVNWSMRLQTGFLSPTGSPGNFMDQNQSGFTADLVRDAPDVFSVPNPVNGVPFQLPFVRDTLPLIIPGPHPVSANTFRAAGDQINLRVPAVGTGGSGNPANDVVRSTITVSGLDPNRRISDLNLNLTIAHARESDLILTLIAPDGTRVRLSRNQPEPLFPPLVRGFLNTTFDDEADVSINVVPIPNPTTAVSQDAAATPYTGTFVPDQPLSDLVGKDPNGVWTLEIEDNTPGVGSIGTLRGWSLSIKNDLVLNRTTNYLDLTFDRDMDAASFERDGRDILRLVGPTGVIDGNLPVASIVMASGLALVTTSRPHGLGSRNLPLVRSITSAGGLATVTTDGAHNLRTGDLVVISGAAQPQYNGFFAVTVTGALTFTYGVGGNPVSPATGNIVASVSAGDLVAISGANQPEYNGTFRVTVLSPTLFVYTLTGAPASPATGALRASAITVTPATHPSLDGDPYIQSLRAQGLARRVFRIGFPTQKLNGTYAATIGPNVQSAAGHRIDTNLNAGLFLLRGESDPQNLVRSLQVVNVTSTGGLATVLTNGPHNLQTGDTVSVSGANEPAYNGVFTIIATGPNTFAYTIAGAPPSPASGNVQVRVVAAVSVSVATPVGQSVPILANSSASFPLTFTDNFAISADEGGTSVGLNITFPDVSNLEGSLIAPDGTVIRLFTRPGATVIGPRNDFRNTILNDRAETSIQRAVPPFGSPPAFTPQTPLDQLRGKGSAGVWTLVITNRSGQVGQIDGWSLTLQKPLPGSGLGELNADQAAVATRIFNLNPLDDVSHSNWVPVGPTAITDRQGFRNIGRISAIAVDPSDPSGNTVYVSGASGGIWKTTNFLTNDREGPTYYPLTDFGPIFSLNIASIVVFPRNNDPLQSIVFALTGEGDGFDAVQPPGDTRNPRFGVGVLRSLNGGATWTLLDSTVNFDAAGNRLATRDRAFVGTTGYKIVVDPTPLRTAGGPETILYMAVGNNGTNRGGIYRSFDTGRTWTRVLVGDANDITLVPGSRDPDTGNVRNLWASIRGQGVFFSTNQGSTWSQQLGGQGNALLRDGDVPGSNSIPLANPAQTPNGAKGRIVLATPAATGRRDLDLFYQDWLYALVATPAGQLDGLYVTKDRGRNWTFVRFPASNLGPLLGTTTPRSFPTNDEAQGTYGVLGNAAFPLGNSAISLAIDPNDPNIVYVGGTAQQQPLTAGGLLRIDTTGLSDPYNFTGFDHRDPASAPGGGQLQAGTVGPLQLKAGALGANYQLFDVDPVTQVRTLSGLTNFLNLSRDPRDPFNSGATVLVSGVAQFNNEGTDIRNWFPLGALLPDGSVSPFNLILTGAPRILTGPGAQVEVMSTTNIHEIIALTDPLTGQTRLLIGNDQGIFTGAVRPDGSVALGIGTASAVAGNRNGNLQLTQFYQGAAQPSVVAAELADALFYGTTNETGAHVRSAFDLLSTGNLTYNNLFEGPLGSGTGVATDPTGSGSAYHYVWRLGGLLPVFTPISTRFFQVTQPGQAPTDRTTGLLQASGGAFPDPQWPQRDGSTFAVNPINRRQIVISGHGTPSGRVFRTADEGLNWDVIANPATLDSSYVRALAYGAPEPNATGNLDNFIWAGTENGNVFVTFNGGGTWLNTGSLDAVAGIPAGQRTPVMKLVANPTRGSREAYAVTRNGVYYMQQAGVTPWVAITGNLFQLTHNPFNDPTLLEPRLRQATGAFAGRTDVGLTSLVVDWRFQVPDGSPDGRHPFLYVGGLGGVFRATNHVGATATWTVFPDLGDGATAAGGLLPNTMITDLTLSAGRINPATGLPEQASGPNLLMATTFGRGQFAIRLPLDSPFNPVSGPFVTSSFGPFRSPAAPGQASFRVAFGQTDPASGLVFTGAIDPSTFTKDDVVLIGPNGPVPPEEFEVVDVTVPAPGQTSNPHNLWEIRFLPAVGNYRLIIGPNITDFAGNRMNQSFLTSTDTVNGETVPPNAREDRFFANFVNNIELLRVVGITPQSPVDVPPGFSSVFVTFSVSVNPATFTLSDLSLVGPGGSVTLTALQNVTPAGAPANTVWQVTFPTQTTLGNYVFTVGADILDTFGVPMNQDRDGLVGEATDDRFTFTYVLRLAPFRAALGAPGSAVDLPPGLTSITVNFNLPVDPATFDAADVTLVGPGGPINVLSVVNANPQTGQVWVINFAPQLTPGTYTLTLGTNIINTITGLALDQDNDGTPGELPSDQFVASITVNPPFQLVSVSPLGTIQAPPGLTTVTLGFNLPVNPATFTAADVQLLGPNGLVAPVAVTNVNPAVNGGRVWQVTFPTQQALGSYQLTVGPNIQNVTGSLLNQNANLVAGEVPGDQFTTTYTIRTPIVTEVARQGGGTTLNVTPLFTVTRGKVKGSKGKFKQTVRLSTAQSALVPEAMVIVLRPTSTRPVLLTNGDGATGAGAPFKIVLAPPGSLTSPGGLSVLLRFSRKASYAVEVYTGIPAV